MMPILFFISGYFTPASFLRKGTVGFLKDKVRHILLPWILGIVVLIPLYPIFSGKPVSYVIGLIKENPFYLFNSQSHLWYLGILFIFLFAYTLFASFIPPASGCVSGSDRKNVVILLVFTVVSVICASLSDIYITPFDNWLYFAYIFTLKPAKIVTYICIFALGVYAWQTNWFTKDGWMPKMAVWRILAIGTMTCYMIIRLIVIPDYNFPLFEKLVPAIDAICSFTTLIYMLLIGIKFQTSRISGFLVNVSPYSYGIYWVHMPLVILYLYLINDLNFSIYLKWASGVLIVCILSWLISKYVLKKLPLLRDMF